VRWNWRGWIVPLALAAAAEAGMRAAGVASDSLAHPSDILLAAFTAIDTGIIARRTAQTLGAALGGLALGGALGLGFGFWLGLSRAAARLAALSIELFRPIPSVALIPIAMLTFGFGYRMEISIVAFACFWPTLLMSQAAVSGIERGFLEVGAVLGLARWQQILKIVLPAALPRVFVAFRLAAGIALVVAVTVEIAANPHGLGYGMMTAQQNLRPDLMLALLLWVGAIGWGLNAMLLAIQHRLFGVMGLDSGR